MAPPLAGRDGAGLTRMRAIENIGALYELARLAALSGCRLRGKYWRWRKHTAFGRGYPASRRETVSSVLAYGRWVRRMRRGT
ncbi:MAG: hypothetical protein WD749_12395 [Phycisphaerales bacterium]